jgi:hypothetical protein
MNELRECFFLTFRLVIVSSYFFEAEFDIGKTQSFLPILSKRA